MALTHPILTRCASQILGIQVVSNGVEQLFSYAGNVDSPHRSNLTPVHFEQVLVLQKWLQMLVAEDPRIEKSRLRLKKLRKFILQDRMLAIADDVEEDADEEDVDADADDLLPDFQPLRKQLLRT